MCESFYVRRNSFFDRQIFVLGARSLDFRSLRWLSGYKLKFSYISGCVDFYRFGKYINIHVCVNLFFLRYIHILTFERYLPHLECNFLYNWGKEIAEVCTSFKTFVLNHDTDIAVATYVNMFDNGTRYVVLPNQLI